MSISYDYMSIVIVRHNLILERKGFLKMLQNLSAKFRYFIIMQSFYSIFAPKRKICYQRKT